MYDYKHFQGVVDFKKEIEKIEKKKKFSEQTVAKLIETTKKDDYETKVCTLRVLEMKSRIIVLMVLVNNAETMLETHKIKTRL